VCGLTYWYVWHDFRIRVTKLLGMCDMTPPGVTRLFHAREILLDSYDMTHVWTLVGNGHGLFWWLQVFCVCSMTIVYMCVIWLLDTCDMTHVSTLLINSYGLFQLALSVLRVWHDAVMCVKWLLNTRDMTCVCVWQSSLICVMWLTPTCDTSRISHVCDMTLWHELHNVLHGFLARITWLFHAWHRMYHTCYMTSYMDFWHLWHDSFMFMCVI